MDKEQILRSKVKSIFQDNEEFNSNYSEFLQFLKREDREIIQDYLRAAVAKFESIEKNSENLSSLDDATKKLGRLFKSKKEVKSVYNDGSTIIMLCIPPLSSIVKRMEKKTYRGYNVKVLTNGR